MAESCDVLVVGGGIAGVAAALCAALDGARVVLVRAGPGASAVCSGAWFDAPPPQLVPLLAAASLPLSSVTGRLPHPSGTLVDAMVAPESHARAALAGTTDRVIVCGIAGLPAFRPVALARLWSNAAGLPPDALMPLTVTLAGTPAAGWSEVSVAALLEREPERLGDSLLRVVREHGAARVILPAVLGLEDHAGMAAHLHAATGIVVGEALGVPPSVPGWRLDVALRTMLAQARVGLIDGRVTAHAVRAARVTSVTIATAMGAREVTAPAMVLATGKFLGGGIDGEARFTETALSCDVVAERRARAFTDAAESLLLSDADRTAPQPLLQLGVRCAADGRPLLASGALQYDNVFVAGSVRAGTDAATLGLGRAAHDGWNAGARAAAYAAA